MCVAVPRLNLFLSDTLILMSPFIYEAILVCIKYVARIPFKMTAAVHDIQLVHS